MATIRLICAGHEYRYDTLSGEVRNNYGTVVQENSHIMSATPFDSAPLLDVPKKVRRRVSASDFYAQGQRSARMGNTRSPGNEYAMPIFGEGRSWQARAFAAGFRDECYAQGRTVGKCTTDF